MTAASAHWPSAALEIGRASLRGGHAGDRAVLETALEQVDLTAIGLAPRALLLVRRIAPSARLGQGRIAAHFAASVTGALRTQLERARRPGESAGDDDALLFIDEAELAAWLIGGWLRGATNAQRQWWPRLIGTTDPQVWWRRTLLRDARLLPRVIARLARDGLGSAWIEKLDDAEIAVALEAIVRTYGISARWPDDRNGIAVVAAPAQQRQTRRIVTRAARHELERLVPEIRTLKLYGSARILLIVALAVHRRPAWAVTGAFADVLATEAQQKPIAAAISGTSGGLHETGAIRRSNLDVPVKTGTPSKRMTRCARPATGAPSHVPIRTEFGGLFYLLNVALCLGFYPDFTRPAAPAIGLSPFDLLDALGRAWFDAEFLADPLADELAALAGRPQHASPGQDFAPSDWSVEKDWLAPWSDDNTSFVCATRHRISLWHSQGFPVAEQRRAKGVHPVEEFRPVLEKLAVSASLGRMPTPKLPTQAAARWLACLRLYLEARLARALGMTDLREAVALTCRRQAQIVRDDDRIEITFALADHPVALRLAGLDRNPGWIPAAGRSIDFEFT